MAKVTAVRQPMTKAQLLSAIAEETGLTRKQVADVMDSLGGQIQRHIKKRGPGTFTLPSLLKIRTVRKPARKARKGTGTIRLPERRRHSPQSLLTPSSRFSR